MNKIALFCAAISCAIYIAIPGINPAFTTTKITANSLNSLKASQTVNIDRY